MRYLVFLACVTAAFALENAEEFSSRSAAGKTEWTYGTGSASPFYWPKLFPEYCAGKRQSPINIDTDQAAQVQFDFFNFEGFAGGNGGLMTLKNNGHTVELAVNGDFFVSGGGLPGANYKVAQLHFHWGNPYAGGSEHTVNGKRYDAEMHMVTFDTKYTSVATAKTHVDGVAVLGAFIQVGYNPDLYGSPLDILLRTLPKVGNKGQSYTFASQLTPYGLLSFLPVNFDWFYRYRGSLTTPPCDEHVIWTLFEQPIIIPMYKMNEFYALYGTEATADHTVQLVDNYRPLQAVNGREIYHSRRNDW